VSRQQQDFSRRFPSLKIAMSVGGSRKRKSLINVQPQFASRSPAEEIARARKQFGPVERIMR
jgi:hypothetical protein